MFTATLSLASVYLSILHLIYHHATTRIAGFPFNQVRHAALKERMGDMLLSFFLFFLPLPAILLHSRLWLSVSTFLTGISAAEEWRTWQELYTWNAEKAWRKTALLTIRP
jgi:hypothetical protein